MYSLPSRAIACFNFDWDKGSLLRSAHLFLGRVWSHETQVLFGSFSLAFFTMWQVGTGDGWSEVARRFTREDGTLHPLTSIFFGGYVFVVGLVLINIVVAVLLVSRRVVTAP